MKPGMLIILGLGKAQPGPASSLAYAWGGKAERPSLLFSRSSRLVGDLHAFAMTRDGQEYYLCANRFAIVRADKDGKSEKVFFTHKTYVRNLRLDNDDNVYFSESSGAGADGKIYRVQPAKDQTAATAALVCTVSLGDVGFWAGDFAFGRAANGGLDTDTIYLSSGNQIPSSIYRMQRKDGKWGTPERVFSARTTIQGLVVTGPREVYYVSGNQVFRLTDLKKLEVVLTLPDVSLRHVSLVPEAAGEKDRK